MALFLALAGAAHYTDVTGRYEAVTESEYGITLTLEEGGTAEFEFRSWEGGEADSEEVERLSGRWSKTGGTVSIELQSSVSALLRANAVSLVLRVRRPGMLGGTAAVGNYASGRL